MIYLDTNVIISFIDEADPNHLLAADFLKGIGKERVVVSRLTLVELASVYSRAELEEPLSLAIYSVEKVGAEVVEADLDEVLVQSFRLAPRLRFRTLDLLHVAACKSIGAKYFATFDKEIRAKAEEIAELGIEVVPKRL